MSQVFLIDADLARKFAPVVSFHAHEQFFPCSIDWLLERSVLRHSQSPLLKEQPGQSDLLYHWQADYPRNSYPYLEVSEHARVGQSLLHGTVMAPMYVTCQEWDDCLEMTYLMLYAFQGGQTLRCLLPPRPFNFIVNEFGQHQGDLEWVTVVLDKTLGQALWVGFAAHGEVRYYPFAQCLKEGDHPLVRAALNGHACRSGPDLIYNHHLAGLLAVVELFDHSGARWRPHELEDGLRLIGLDGQGEPLGGQIWAKFQGKLGKTSTNRYTCATRVDGTPLRIRAINPLLRLAERWLASGLTVAQGTAAPGDPGRLFTHGLRRAGGGLPRIQRKSG